MFGAIQQSYKVPSFTSYNWTKHPWLLLLLFYMIPYRQCEPHSLRYFYTGMSQSGELKEFQEMTYIDDQQIMTCKKKEIICHPVASWMKDKVDDTYWVDKHNSFIVWQKAFYENLLLLKHRFNHTNDLLILQLWYGCEEQNDGEIKADYHYGFDGRDYSLFDIISIAWDPIMMNAQDTDKRRNIKRHIMESVESYLKKICPTDLNKYIAYGNDTLEWKDPPEGKIIPLKETHNAIRLQCLVYGFHPRAVDVKWVKNGVDQVPSYESSPILPHPDGTYQIRVNMEIPKREGYTYACHIDHSSLEKEIIIMWYPKRDVVSRILGVLLPGVIILFIIYILYRICIKQAIGDNSHPSGDSSGPSLELLQIHKFCGLLAVNNNTGSTNVYTQENIHF